MKRLIFLFLFIPSTAYAGQIVCFNESNEITQYEPKASGEAYDGRADCIHVSMPPYKQEEFDAVKDLFINVPRKHILHKDGAFGEMTTQEKAELKTAEDAEAQAILDAQAAKDAIKASAEQKLKGLGLSDDEIAVLTEKGQGLL